MSSIIVRGEETNDGDFQFGETGFFKVEGAAATGAVVTAFAVNCSRYTGKKAILISQTAAVSGSLVIASFGSYDPLLTQAEFETLIEAAGDEKIIALTNGAATIISSGTSQKEITTTNPYKWIGITVTGNTFTYNAYFSGV